MLSFPLRFWRIFALLAFVFLAGCAQAPKKVDLDKTVGEKIKKIVVLQVKEPKRIVIMGSAGQQLGISFLLGPMIGGAINNAVINSRSEIFAKELNDRSIKIGPLVANTLQEKLRQQGFEVVYLPNESVRLTSDGKEDDYSHIKTDADAILNVWLNVVGYTLPPSSDDYQPWLSVGARLLDTKTKKVLYFRIFNIGSEFVNNEDIETLSSNEKYRYDSFDALIMRFDQAVEGIENSQEKVVNRIVQQISQK